jgi:thioredoxin reductase (NADPH)
MTEFNRFLAARPQAALLILSGLLKKLGVKTESGKLTEVPVYDPDTFETDVPGLYVAGHFTHARHIKEAIAVPLRIVPLIAQSLRSQTKAAIHET